MMYLVGLALIFLIVSVIFLRVYISSGTKCSLDRRLDGKVIIITGGNSGIGKAAALELAKRGARVIIGCRNKVKAEAAVTLIRRRTGSDAVHYLPLDLASLESVKQFVDMFIKQYGPAYALVNNAGYMGPKQMSHDRYDLCFQVNYLGHYYLTQLLIQKSKPDKSSPLRVINVVSDSYVNSLVDFDDIMIERNSYQVFDAYGRTKLALIWFSNELNYRYWDSAVTSVPIHPDSMLPPFAGLLEVQSVQTSYTIGQGLSGRVLRLMAKLFFRSPETGAQSIVHSALVGSLEDYIGKLVYDCKPIRLAAVAKDHRKAERLWDISWDMCPLEDLKMKIH
ncbi:hypothetical protein LSH36_374g01021 [Paralvinella palmiformis]|uniref:Uncharacterized protein n=1 Tax=Paralvinella palmiformis TaxID=53620 RepID=A0AAD9MZ42_9ANNE|nr:hypothetical protein LSH36_374g01021 [Paralvinella palmiformis]